MAAAAEDIVRDEESGRQIAERWGLEYIKAASLSVDPSALSLLTREDCKKLRAIPIASGSSGPLVVVSAPSEKRFAAIRERTGDSTRFALINEETLEALLGSRMFAEATDRAAAPTPEDAPAEAAPAEPVEAPAESPEPPAAAAEAEALPAGASVEAVAASVLAALEQRLPALLPGLGALPARPDDPDSVSTPSELVAHVDATIQTWSALRNGLTQLEAEVEESRRALREAKEQLSVAHAENDQLRNREATLDAEVAEARTLAAQARARLQEAAALLNSEAVEDAAHLD